MITILKHEFRLSMKSLMIWSLTVGAFGFLCIILYSSMTEDMQALSESFSNMGAFSDAFGMSTLGIGTLEGFFSTEVGVVHGLGSGMFAAVISTVLLSKEEDGHTGEFLYSLPVSRAKVVTAKLAACLLLIVLFTVITGILYWLGTICLGESLDMGSFAKYMFSAFLMNIEVACVCTALSAFAGRNMPGAGLGIVLLFYMFDITGRVVPDVKDYIVLGPYSIANATDIFAGNDVAGTAYIALFIVSALAVLCAYAKYTRKDLAS